VVASFLHKNIRKRKQIKRSDDDSDNLISSMYQLDWNQRRRETIESAQQHWWVIMNFTVEVGITS